MTGVPLPLETPMPWRELVVARTGQSPPRDFDDPVPNLGPGVEALTRRTAEESVATVRQLVFPRHGLR
jgi:hypothetical protein